MNVKEALEYAKSENLDERRKATKALKVLAQEIDRLTKPRFRAEHRYTGLKSFCTEEITMATMADIGR